MISSNTNFERGISGRFLRKWPLLALLCLFIIGLLLYSNTDPPSSQMSIAKLVSVDFEVFGRVQGVFFRKYTEKTATGLGLVGWCRNTHDGTVKGQVQGELNNVADMKRWLQSIGSPHSKIEKAVFENEKAISKLDHSDFTIRR